MENPLVCPTCARTHSASERFCESCGMPLVHVSAGEGVASERRDRARKIKPQYADGELVKVAGAENLAQAEFISGMLLEEGIPSVLRGSGGLVAAYAATVGSCDVLVPESGAEAAREALAWEGGAPG
jgi:hypothetical protein